MGDCLGVLGEGRGEMFQVIPKGGVAVSVAASGHEPFARGGRVLLRRSRDPRSWSLTKSGSGCTEHSPLR